MKNLLIIGGGYFLGRVFVENLAQNNDCRTYVLNRGNCPLDMKGVVELKCDRNDISTLKALLPEQTWHAVIDFCGYTPQDINNLFSVIPDGMIEQYIFISTVSVYAPTKKLPIKEEALTLTGPQPELGPAAGYGYQKLLAERSLATQAARRNIPFTILRPSIIYGRYNYAPRESYFFDLIHKRQVGVIPENDLPLFQFIFVMDAARIIFSSVGNPETYNKTYNLAAPELISYGRMYEVIESISGLSVPKRYMSATEIDKLRLPLPFPLNSHLIYSGELVQQALGFKYTSFMEGMQRTYAWYCNK